MNKLSDKTEIALKSSQNFDTSEHLSEQLRLAENHILFLEEKIQKMEQSRFWRIRLFLLKIKSVLLSRKGNKRRHSGFIFRFLKLFTSFGRKKIRTALKSIFRYLYLVTEDVPVKIITPEDVAHHTTEEIGITRRKFSPNERIDRSRQKEELSFFKNQPLISILLNADNNEYLEESILSVAGQIYQRWELFVLSDSNVPEIIAGAIQKFPEAQQKINIITPESTTTLSYNKVLGKNQGTYVSFMNSGDLLTNDALFEMVRMINLYPDADFIYSDEDRITSEGKFAKAFYKPDWNSDTLLSRNYIGHFALLKKKLIQEVSGFLPSSENHPEYDLFLRVSEKTRHIYHIPKILYHQRINSTYSVSNISATTILQETLDRRGEKAVVKEVKGLPGHYLTRYKILEEKKVSIIIPTKNQSKVLRTCLESIFSTTSYKNFEVIVIDNNSNEQALYDLLNEYSGKYSSFHWESNAIPFNFSRLMNEAVKKTSGEYLLFLNNDTEVISTDWIEAMMEQCQRPSIGMAGARLLFPNNTIQHAGVVIGLGGVAGHIFTGAYKDSPGYYGFLQSVTNYSAVTGACMMCRRNIFDEVKGFDESLTVEYNDIDLCLKIKEAGYNNIYLPHAVLYHHESLSRGNPYNTQESMERHLRESKIFSDRWKNYIEHDPCYNIHFSTVKVNFEVEHYDY